MGQTWSRCPSRPRHAAHLRTGSGTSASRMWRALRAPSSQEARPGSGRRGRLRPAVRWRSCGGRAERWSRWPRRLRGRWVRTWLGTCSTRRISPERWQPTRSYSAGRSLLGGISARSASSTSSHGRPVKRAWARLPTSQTTGCPSALAVPFSCRQSGRRACRGPVWRRGGRRPCRAAGRGTGGGVRGRAGCSVRALRGKRVKSAPLLSYV